MALRPSLAGRSRGEQKARNASTTHQAAAAPVFANEEIAFKAGHPGLAFTAAVAGFRVAGLE